LLLAAGTLVTVSSLALFSDQAIVGGTGLTSGTVDLNASPASAVITAPTMRPGDRVVSELEVTNSGTVETRYAATSFTTENTLAAELRLTVKIDVSNCAAADFFSDGTVLYDGALGTVDGTPIFGDPTGGAHDGDRVLAAGADESFCLAVALPASAGADVAGRTTTATFEFAAEQTVNNP
jgi:hypothetical protein